MSAASSTEHVTEAEPGSVSIEIDGEPITLRPGDEFTGELRALGRIVITGCAFAEPVLQ
jgi:hypothetical protein